MPMINIEDAYTLDETGAQVDKVTGLYFKNENASDTEKAQARANIGAGGSNRNLLDNPWFTVNQRGQSSYTGRVYGVDRWIEYGTGNTVTVTNNGITLPIDTNSGFEQYFDDTFIQGKTVTISFMTADGTVTSKTVTWPTSGANRTAYSNGVAFFYGTVVGKNGLAILTNAEVTLRAVKLELGSVSTLANDAPPDYGEELAKCQRYFARIKTIGTYPYAPLGIGAYTNSTTIRMGIFTPVPMRAVPSSISFSGSLIACGGGNEYTVNRIGVIDATPNTAFANVVVSSAPTAHHTYTMLGTTGSYIDISADL